jgi:hypothetical protein
VIEPHQSARLTIEASNVYKDKPLQIGSVMFADGSEEVCREALELLHKVRAEEEKS